MANTNNITTKLIASLLCILFHQTKSFRLEIPLHHVKNTCRLQTKLQVCSDSDNDQRSVSDYVKNVHGGKYQFGNSLVGQEFAESLYSSSNYDNSDSEQLIDPNEDLPKWTQRMIQNASTKISSKDTITSTDNIILLGENFKITNEERSWERFYAFILPETKRNVFRVIPETGHLAPRGGASNICDENKPYLDTAVIRVIQNDDVNSICNNLGDDYCCHVVVGTEEATWFYKVVK